MHIIKNLFIGMLFVLIMCTIIGCTSINDQSTDGSTINPTTIPSEKGMNTVIIKEFEFQPKELTIQKGEKVTWTNEDSANHTITSTSFDSGNIGKGKSYEYTFDTAGIFEYACKIHPSMKGTIIVN